MKCSPVFILGLVAGSLSPALPAGQEPTTRPQKEAVRTDPVMVELARLVGGTWSNHNPRFLIENHYEWAFGDTVVRGSGVAGKGTAHEAQIESFLGWDPVSRSVFYMDCHGGNTIYQGQTW
jgi:hypothetical protein